MSSISSEAMPASRPVWSVVLMMSALANSSSFCTSSPWTLVRPVRPITSARPALLTSRAMILAAMLRSVSKPVNSPVASGCCRSSSMMKRVRVVPICMRGLASIEGV